MENRFVRVAEDDPTRCQGVFKGGQCPYGAMHPSKYCTMHGGNVDPNKIKAKAVHDFRLTQWQERVDTFAGSQRVKSLRGEIGIARLTLEQVLGQIKTDVQFPLFVDKISSIVTQIEKLVNSCQKIEERNKELLGKNDVIVIADTVIEVMARYIKDPDELLEAQELLHELITAVICGQGETGTSA